MPHTLVIEQSAAMRQSIEHLLLTAGMSVDAVPSFGSALELLNNEPHKYEFIVIATTAYYGAEAGYLFSLLSASGLAHLAVVIINDDSDSALGAWVELRERCTRLGWSEVEQLADCLQALQTQPLSKPQQHGSYRPPVRPDAGRADKLRILLLDHCVDTLARNRTLFIRHGYLVDAVSSASDAFELALRSHYDLAVIDFHLGAGENTALGIELCRRLRSDPRTEYILPVIYTEVYHDQVIRESLHSGAVDCLFKKECESLFVARINAICRGVSINNAVLREREHLSSILESVGDAVYGVNKDGTIDFMNSAAQTLLGLDENEYIGKKPEQLFSSPARGDQVNAPDQAALQLSQAHVLGNRIENWQTEIRTRDGRPLFIECTVNPLMVNRRRMGSVIAFRDISERRLIEEELRWQANHDSLTKLLNRRYFETQLEQEIARIQRVDELAAVLYLDLDRFKYINDVAGHAAGDQLLIEISQHLQNQIRAADVLARIGGDEFAILLRNICVDSIYLSAEKFRRLLSDYCFIYDGIRYDVNVSVGVAVIDQQYSNAAMALAHADLAANIAKETGRNQTHVYNVSTDDCKAVDMKMGWSRRLKLALKEERFQLVYQPIINSRLAMAGEQLAGQIWNQEEILADGLRCEVLLRLPGGDNRIISPTAFLPAAERFNFMPQLDCWVLKQAISCLGEELRRGNKLSLSINLSAQTLAEAGFPAFLIEQLSLQQVQPECLILEIPESVAVNNLEMSVRSLKSIKEIGIKLALDNFGSGICSFSHLKNLNVDYLKIDGLFTQGVVSDAIDREVISAITNIAHSQGIKTIAERVENERTLAQLLKCGVDFVQGHYLACPMDALPSRQIPDEGGSNLKAES